MDIAVIKSITVITVLRGITDFIMNEAFMGMTFTMVTLNITDIRDSAVSEDITNITTT
jgi:hypothetical protein